MVVVQSVSGQTQTWPDAQEPPNTPPTTTMLSDPDADPMRELANRIESLTLRQAVLLSGYLEARGLRLNMKH